MRGDIVWVGVGGDRKGYEVSVGLLHGSIMRGSNAQRGHLRLEQIEMST